MATIEVSLEKEKQSKREHPRIDSPFGAFIALGPNTEPTYYLISIENICTGGLLFSCAQEKGWGDKLVVGASARFIFILPEPFSKIRLEGSVRRIEESSDGSRYAVEFDSIEQRRRFDDFLDRCLTNPFGCYFLANDLKSSIRGCELLKYPRTKRLFTRIQQTILQSRYTFQQPIESIDKATAVIDGTRKIIMSSYNYLGLLKDPRVMRASIEAIERYGTGASGVRLLTGTTSLHVDLENRIARFKGMDAAIVYNSGYVTNMAVISTIFDKQDVILVDYHSHQSIVDGCKLSGINAIKFNHNDMADLEQYLQSIPLNQRKLIATDAVFSMDGDIAPMPEIVGLARNYNAYILVDEAHAFGVLGKTGRGINEYFGLKPDDIDIYMGTMSKALPSSGGYVAGARELIYYLKHASNSFIFSAALTPADTAAALRSLEILEEDSSCLERLRRNIDHFSGGLKDLGFETMNSQTAIIPILVGDEWKAHEMAKQMNDRNVFVCPVVFPAVQKSMARIRNCVMANHTIKQLNYVLNAYEKVGRSLDLI